jgi:nitrate/nitrite-specific signal transduction histidine kinase
MKIGIFLKTFIISFLIGILPLFLFYFLVLTGFKELEKFISEIEPLFPELAHRMEEFFQNIKIQAFLVSLFIFVIIFFYSLIYSRSLMHIINKLVKGSEKIAKGDYGERVKIKTGDEFEKIGEAFNKMAQQLKEKTEALEEEKLSLEIKVAARTRELKELIETQEKIIEERTKEIKKKMEELEKFQRLAVGRELKMIELKKEIERLKKELEKYKTERSGKNKI